MPSRRFTWLASLLVLASLLAPPRASWTQDSAAQPAQQRKTSTPYTGDLSIFDSPGRDEKLHINRVMDILSIVPGKTVADIGAGSGWFTVRAAKRVTESGVVYAVDINPEAVRHVAQRAKQEYLLNVKTVLSKADNPELPADTIDAVLLLKTYHEVASPVALLRNLRTSLRANARVGVIDRTGNGEDHGVQKAVVIREAGQAGYRLLEEHDDLVKADQMDYFLVFAAK
ncbi:MAG: class I SAM-dependent methyltransferase [Candidatus Korobacteraceae bacterium]|jgi:SAM-dependent methyltransferase